MSDPVRLARAAHNILTRSLGLRRDQNLLIFADASSLEVVEVMARAARDLDIATSTLFVPRVLQADTRAGESLPLPVEAAIRESDAVLSCLSDRPEHFSYRMRLLNSSWSRRTKLAHAPGMTLEILAAADTDYDAIAERARAAVRRARPGQTAGSGHRGRPRAGVPADRRRSAAGTTRPA